MAYKVTISDGTILEKSIESVKFKADTPPDDSYCMFTYTKNSMQITGRIGAGEKTISLYEWSLLPANNPGCYKEIVVEQTHADQTVRIVKFSKAFVVDYSESYAKGEGFGLFSIFIRQLAGVDIELTNKIAPQPATTEPSNKVEELIPPLVQSEGIVSASPIVKKNRPSLTDMIAKKKMMQDNDNAGVSNVKTLMGKGQQFTNGRKNKLKPDIRYKTGEYNYFYETDHAGRISKFETDNLKLTKRTDRLPHSKNTPGKIKGKDDAGHLAGDRFGGSPKIDNLVSQLSDVNQKQYKKIENKWAESLNDDPPKKVTVNVDMVYSEKDMRPEKFLVKYTIDGKPSSIAFKNN